MTVLRIVANIDAASVSIVRDFYSNLFGLEAVMDHGWIVTMASHATAAARCAKMGFELGKGVVHLGLGEREEMDVVEIAFESVAGIEAGVRHCCQSRRWRIHEMRSRCRPDAHLLGYRL